MGRRRNPEEGREWDATQESIEEAQTRKIERYFRVQPANVIGCADSIQYLKVRRILIKKI